MGFSEHGWGQGKLISKDPDPLTWEDTRRGGEFHAEQTLHAKGSEVGMSRIYGRSRGAWKSGRSGAREVRQVQKWAGQMKPGGGEKSVKRLSFSLDMAPRHKWPVSIRAEVRTQDPSRFPLTLDPVSLLGR